MALRFQSLHRAPSPELLNEEWIILENTGPGVLSSAGWSLEVAKSRSVRPHPVGTLQPGFLIQAGEKVRLVTGTPAKKAQGAPPIEKDGIKNYFLFLRAPILTAPGLMLHMRLKQLEVAAATFDPNGKDGLAARSA